MGELSNAVLKMLAIDRQRTRAFMSFSTVVISGQWEDDNVRLCAMEPGLGLEQLPPAARFKARTTRSAGQHLAY